MPVAPLARRNSSHPPHPRAGPAARPMSRYVETVLMNPFASATGGAPGGCMALMEQLFPKVKVDGHVAHVLGSL